MTGFDAAAHVAPTPDAVAETRRRIAPHILETPLVPWPGTELGGCLAPGTSVSIKLELLQRTGSFKPRGAINTVMSFGQDQLARGLTAISAGNHAIAVGYAARIAGTTAKVVMPKTANPFRVAMCRSYGAEVVLAEDVVDAYRIVKEISEGEGRAFVHPFEGPYTVTGTATVGLEMLAQMPDVEAIIVPIGGGGLIAGIASYVKQVKPGCKVYGVEPAGARGMTDSLAAEVPLPKVPVKTIADSLGAPLHTPYTFAVAQRYVDDVVTIEDADTMDAMGLMFRDAKLAVEPAPAIAVAALIGPLRERCAGRRVLLTGCGTNIDPGTYMRYLGEARPIHR